MKLDLQDWLLLVGVVCVCTGVGFIYWPASLILLGLLCLSNVLLIERAKRFESPDQTKKQK